MSRFAGVIVAGACALLGACSSSLQGKAIRGDYSGVEVVSDSDPRLAERGLSGVSVHVQLDPTKLKRETLGRAVSASDGSFSIPVDQFGAGVLEYDIGVYARRRGCEPAEAFFRLPGSGKRLLVIMTEGEDKDTTEQPSSLRDEFNLKSFENR